MNSDEIAAKLREYEEAGGDDAVLPAVLRVLLESNQQHANELEKSQETHTKALIESRQQHANELAESQKSMGEKFAAIHKEQETHAKSLLESNRKLSDKLTTLQKAMTENITSIQQEQKAHAETVKTRINVAIGLVVIGAIAVLAAVLSP
ncbi:MAG: hypothetical protein OXU88_06430 [Gammaproteobacteria bacterium]|nr:hypothetical protein [Gammaproteobacteria bacterium]